MIPRRGPAHRAPGDFMRTVEPGRLGGLSRAGGRTGWKCPAVGPKTLPTVPAQGDRGRWAASGRRHAMGIARRIAELYQVKVNALLDRAEDPREMLDYSYTQQQEFLRRMRSAVADVAAGRDRARAQEDGLRRAADRLRVQAEQAVAAGQEDLGRDALAHRAEMIAHADDLAAEQAALRVEEERLAEETRRLEARFEVFRCRKEALKAAYTGVEAAAAGAPADSLATVADVVEAARRAEDKTAALQARAAAL